MEQGFFSSALPIWAEGRETEKNITLGLYAAVTAPDTPVTLRVATSGFYRVFLNGRFMHYGPARCAKGFFRVDELPLSLPGGPVHLAIEVVNYYVASFVSVRQPGFILAELTTRDACLAATGREGFSLYYLTQRVQKLPRYSFQRPFIEGYRFTPGCDDWRMGTPSADTQPVDAAVTPAGTLLPRRLALPTFPAVPFQRREAFGTLQVGKAAPAPFSEDSSFDDRWEFPPKELVWRPAEEVRGWTSLTHTPDGELYTDRTALTGGQYEILSLPCEKTGFLAAEILCRRAGSLYFLVDEILTGQGEVDPLRLNCCNVLRLDLTPGTYSFQAMEPLGLRYVKTVATDGEFVLSGLCIRELICPQPVTAAYTGRDPELAAIFDAARESFLQCSADLFMDCPTRERAGWLCDSFFTARAEKRFTGANVIEKNFLENYLLPDRFPDLPEGMIPMCYPADHIDHNFIPNWAMWFVLELEDRLDRVGDRAFILSFRERVYGILRWFCQYENADGLLENLPGWVFLDWSFANELTRGINYPTNMLYARMLEAIASLFDDPPLADQAARLKAVIRRQSFDGHFFADCATRQEDAWERMPVCTEACQYYAFFTGVATPQTHPALWHTLITDFGPQRTQQGLYPEIHPCNAFIGNYLRLVLLEEAHLRDRLLEEIREYFLYMARRTGTLWENIDERASCNHGFASYAARLIPDVENR